jgi:hypothetical protein
MIEIMRFIILSLLLVSCGPAPGLPDAADPGPNGSGPCVPIDIYQTCGVDASAPAVIDYPDAAIDSSPDARESPPGCDAGLTDERHAACCHALLDGTPPNQDCGYPPGLCRNGRKTMFCVDADGSDAQFEMCNP